MHRSTLPVLAHPLAAWILCMVAASLAGCAGYQSFREGNAQLAEGKVEPGLSNLKHAVDQSPDNVEYRRSYFTQREAAVNALLHQAEVAIDSGDFAAARDAYAKVLRVDS